VIPRVPIHTERLRLEPTGPEHADALWTAVDASRSELRRWLIWANDSKPERTREFAEGCRTGWDKAGWTFAIHEGHELIGGIGLDDHNELISSVELGYWLRTDRAGRGLMTEAGRAVIEFAFERIGLHRIELHADIRNAASIRVAEKLGFTRGGVLRDGERNVDGWHDCYVFDLLSGEVS
jgi:ribosomal-protein-serine acetyltransferase